MPDSRSLALRLVKGTTNGITDAEGRFYLMVGTPAGAQLQHQLPGLWQSQTLAVGSRTSPT